MPVGVATVAGIHMRDTRANQPLASDVGIGTIYFVTDELLLERSNGAIWEPYSSAGGIYYGVIQVITGANYAMLDSDYAVFIATNGGDRTVTLPTPASRRAVFIKKTDGELFGTVQVLPNGTEKIEGTLNDWFLERQASFVELVYVVDNWQIVRSA